MAGETRRLDRSMGAVAAAEPTLRPIDLGMPRPWRVALKLVESGIQLIFDVSGTIVIGRANPQTGYYPDVDLGAFGGADSGVSREHLSVKIDEERVVIIDNNSANGTILNGERLQPGRAYPLRHGDEVTLGLLKLQVELLTNPYM